MDDRYTVGSLFAGIGGIDLGLERTGYFRTAWVCERDAYCQRVLAKHWPDVPVYDDVADIGADTPAVDVIAAGFPCQPVSHAGRRKAQEDERWLWPHVERCISVLRPRGVLLENVPGLFTAGFGDVIGGLAACGYAAEWDCIPAAAVGAPHRRDRVFVVAARPDVAQVNIATGWPNPMEDTSGAGPVRIEREVVEGPQGLTRHPHAAGPIGEGKGTVMADTFSAGPQRHRRPVAAKAPEHPTARSAVGTAETMADTGSIGQQGQGQPIYSRSAAENKDWETSEFVHVCFPREWEPEPNVGRVADGVPKRVDRLRALGNAVVPQVAEYVGHQLARVMGATNA